MTINRRLAAAIAVIASAMHMPLLQAAGCAPEELIQAYEQANSPAEAARQMAARMDNSLKPSKALKEVMAGVSNGTLAKEMEQVVDVTRAYRIDPRTLSSSKLVQYYRSVDIAEQPALPRLSSTFDAMAGLAAAAQFSTNLYAAVTTGDRNAILDINKQAAELGLGMALSRAGMQAAQTGTAIGGFLDYALTSLIDQELSGYEEYWWNAYRAYLDKRYPKMVTGSGSWAALAMRNDGGQAFNARLLEFWSDEDVAGDGIGSALERATHYYQAPAGLRRGDALAMAKYRQAFAARYYGDFLKTTLDTYFRREAEKARAELQERVRSAATNYCGYLNDLEQLAAKVQEVKSQAPKGLTPREKKFLAQCTDNYQQMKSTEARGKAMGQEYAAWKKSAKSAIIAGIQAQRKTVKGLAEEANATLARYRAEKNAGADTATLKVLQTRFEQQKARYTQTKETLQGDIRRFKAWAAKPFEACGRWVPEMSSFGHLASLDTAGGQRYCDELIALDRDFQAAAKQVEDNKRECAAVQEKQRQALAARK